MTTTTLIGHTHDSGTFLCDFIDTDTCIHTTESYLTGSTA
jgi:hypothetical protein